MEPPRENDAKKQGLPSIQLFNLKLDKGEEQLAGKERLQTEELIGLLDQVKTVEAPRVKSAQ